MKRRNLFYDFQGIILEYFLGKKGKFKVIVEENNFSQEVVNLKIYADFMKKNLQ